MFCPQCGAANPENAQQCSACGTMMRQLPPAGAPVQNAPGVPQRPAVTIENYLVPSIIVTILCCWPAGIPAIIYASQVNTKLSQGDIAGAQQSSKNAKTWCIVSVIAPLVGIVLYIIVIAIFGGIAALTNHS